MELIKARIKTVSTFGLMAALGSTALNLGAQAQDRSLMTTLSDKYACEIVQKGDRDPIVKIGLDSDTGAYKAYGKLKVHYRGVYETAEVTTKLDEKGQLEISFVPNQSSQDLVASSLAPVQPWTVTYPKTTPRSLPKASDADAKRASSADPYLWRFTLGKAQLAVYCQDGYNSVEFNANEKFDLYQQAFGKGAKNLDEQSGGAQTSCAHAMARGEELIVPVKPNQKMVGGELKCSLSAAEVGAALQAKIHADAMAELNLSTPSDPFEAKFARCMPHDVNGNFAPPVFVGIQLEKDKFLNASVWPKMCMKKDGSSCSTAAPEDYTIQHDVSCQTENVVATAYGVNGYFSDLRLNITHNRDEIAKAKNIHFVDDKGFMSRVADDTEGFGNGLLLHLPTLLSGKKADPAVTVRWKDWDDLCGRPDQQQGLIADANTIENWETGGEWTGEIALIFAGNRMMGGSKTGAVAAAEMGGDAAVAEGLEVAGEGVGAGTAARALFGVADSGIITMFGEAGEREAVAETQRFFLRQTGRQLGLRAARALLKGYVISAGLALKHEIEMSVKTGCGFTDLKTSGCAENQAKILREFLLTGLAGPFAEFSWFGAWMERVASIDSLTSLFILRAADSAIGMAGMGLVDLGYTLLFTPGSKDDLRLLLEVVTQGVRMRTLPMYASLPAQERYAAIADAIWAGLAQKERAEIENLSTVMLEGGGPSRASKVAAVTVMTGVVAYLFMHHSIPVLRPLDPEKKITFTPIAPNPRKSFVKETPPGQQKGGGGKKPPIPVKAPETAEPPKTAPVANLAAPKIPRPEVQPKLPIITPLPVDTSDAMKAISGLGSKPVSVVGMADQGTGKGSGAGSGDGQGVGRGGGAGGGDFAAGNGEVAVSCKASGKPQFTSEARESGITGTILLTVTVDKSGAIVRPHVDAGGVQLLDRANRPVVGSDFGLTNKAVEWVRGALKCSPKLVHNQPVEDTQQIRAHFTNY